MNVISHCRKFSESRCTVFWGKLRHGFQFLHDMHIPKCLIKMAKGQLNSSGIVVVFYLDCVALGCPSRFLEDHFHASTLIKHTEPGNEGLQDYKILQGICVRAAWS